MSIGAAPAGPSCRQVYLVESPELLRQADRIHSVKGRVSTHSQVLESPCLHPELSQASQVSSLIHSCGLTSSVSVVPPSSREESAAAVEGFHSADYVDFLKRLAEHPVFQYFIWFFCSGIW